MSRKRAYFLVYAILLLLPSALMAGALWRGAIPNFMDNVMYFFPLRVHAARLLHGGEFPLWNRCLMGGMPLFENPQAAIAYPLHWLFFVWPNGFWFLWPMLLQLGAYAALTAWALRRMGAEKKAAWFGGALALAGSYGWSRLQYGNYMNVLPWWPLWIGAAHFFIQSRRGVIIGILAVALSIVGGAHQIAAYGLALLAVYAFAQAAMDRTPGKNWLVFVAVTYSLAIVFLSTPGWFPQYGFISQTSRPGGLDPKAVLDGTIGSAGELFRALCGDWKSLAPGAWADAEVAVSIGPIALLLALLVPPRGRLRRAWIACWVAALVGILLSLRMVMEPLLNVFPAAGIFHGPRRWLGAAQWFLILAAALGSTRLYKVRIAALGTVVRAAAVLVAAVLTWGTVERATIPARQLLDAKPLIARTGL